MTSPHYTRLLARALRGSNADATPEVSAESRAAGIAAIEAALAKRQQRRWRGRMLALSSVAAALLLGLGALSQFAMRNAPSASAASAGAREQPIVIRARTAGADCMLVDAAGSTPLREGGELVPGRAVVTGAHASAAFELSTGTHLLIEPTSQLAVLDNRRTQHFELRAGSMQANVAKLGAGERFIIGTPDAEVEVHGTAFRVEVVSPAEACSGSQTRVIVTQGVVSVRHGGGLVRVPAGSQWPAVCAVVPPPATLQPSASSVAPAASPLLELHPHTPALAEQNSAFGRAIAATRAGDRQAALSRFSDFLRRYPTSQLRESAAVEQLRLLIDLDPARARDAARSYLEAYPDGAAQREAERAIEGGL